MRIIHLSDLHLGKNISGFSFDEVQKDILNKILKITTEEKADAVIIAGDIYDVGVPNEKAIAIFDQFLTSLMKKGIPTFVITGNHDSAQRVSFGNKIMEAANIYVSSAYKGEVKPITLNDKWGKLNIYLLPYIRLSSIRKLFPEKRILTLTDAMDTVIKEMKINKDERNILVCHQFITGSNQCDSEEVNVGGLDNIDAKVFDDFDYVALGHLHGPQNVGGDKRICYCGTPLKYSFSEINHKKGVKVIDFEEKKNGKTTCTHKWIPLTPLHDMKEIRGKFDDIIAGKIDESVDKEDFLHIILTDEDDVVNGLPRLQSVYKNIMKMDYDNKRTQNQNELKDFEAFIGMEPFELVEKFYKYRNNKDMSKEESSYMKEIISEIWQGEE